MMMNRVWERKNYVANVISKIGSGAVKKTLQKQYQIWICVWHTIEQAGAWLSQIRHKGLSLPHATQIQV